MKKIYFLLFVFASFIFAWSQNYQEMIADGTFTVQEIKEAANNYFAEKGYGRGTGFKAYKR